MASPEKDVPQEQSIVVQPQTALVPNTLELETSIQGFNAPLATYLGGLGLPTKQVLVEFGERQFVLQSLGQTLAVLPYDERTKAFYLSKFSVAIMVGLFDAALNYLWDEAILALRRLAASIDLSYFFDTAEKREPYRARLQTEEDLRLLDDLTLIDTCARVDLLSDVNRERLRHVNYMRNHASAAHPNQSELTGQEMVAWLSNCLRYAITAKPEHAVIATKQLLANIRTTLIPAKDIPVISIDLQKLRSLHAAHNGMNNFYNEGPHAQALQSSLPVSGIVPRAAELEWVKVVVKCHLGNGLGYYGGVDTTADRYYQGYISRFGEREIAQTLRSFSDPDFTVDFDSAVVHRRAMKLATAFKARVKNVYIIRALDAVLSQPEGTLRKLATVTKFREAVGNLPT